MSERTLLMLPGPIEVDPEVLRALARPQLGHRDPPFTAAFARVLTRSRDVFQAPTGQPIVVAGSGTLGMEIAVTNVIDPGERAVVVNTGFFSDRMGKVLERLGAKVDHVRAPLGVFPDLADIEKAIVAAQPKLVTITHVDTSTGIRAPIEAVARIARERGALVAVDGVCSIGGEEFRQDAWGVDVCVTGSQKAIGAPPGLAIVMAGPRAVEAWRAKKVKVPSLYLDFGEWIPVMESYEKNGTAYFATPPVNGIMALDVAVGHIVAEGMEARYARHRRLGAAFRAAWKALELPIIPSSEGIAASTMSAVYYPNGIDVALIGRVAAEGVTIAGGIHPEARTRYFRVGHMGSMKASDVLACLGAIERALVASGHRFAIGSAVAAAQAALVS